RGGQGFAGGSADVDGRAGAAVEVTQPGGGGVRERYPVLLKLAELLVVHVPDVRRGHIVGHELAGIGEELEVGEDRGGVHGGDEALHHDACVRPVQRQNRLVVARGRGGVGADLLVHEEARVRKSSGVDDPQDHAHGGGPGGKARRGRNGHGISHPHGRVLVAGGVEV